MREVHIREGVLENTHSKSRIYIFRMSFYGNGPRIKESQLGDRAG